MRLRRRSPQRLTARRPLPSMSGFAPTLTWQRSAPDCGSRPRSGRSSTRLRRMPWRWQAAYGAITRGAMSPQTCFRPRSRTAPGTDPGGTISGNENRSTDGGCMRAYRSQGCHPARLLPVLAAAMLVASAPVAVAQPAWKPQKPLEIIAASAPGGGTDKTARLIQRIIQERQLAEVASAVVNKSGGGGAMSLTYLKQHGGDAHFVNIASAVLLTNHISGRSTFSYADFTPIALLNSEYVTLAVKSDSPVQNVKDLVARLAK